VQRAGFEPAVSSINLNGHFAALLAAVFVQVANKQRQRETAAAAAEQGLPDGGYELQMPLDVDDDIMGEGFSSFISRNENSEPAALFYEDELDEDFSEFGAEDAGEAEEAGEATADNS
jgi:hypothetical protein